MKTRSLPQCEGTGRGRQGGPGKAAGGRRVFGAPVVAGKCARATRGWGKGCEAEREM